MPVACMFPQGLNTVENYLPPVVGTSYTIWFAAISTAGESPEGGHVLQDCVLTTTDRSINILAVEVAWNGGAGNNSISADLRTPTGAGGKDVGLVLPAGQGLDLVTATTIGSGPTPVSRTRASVVWS